VRSLCARRLCNTSGVGGVADNDYYYHSEQCAGSQRKHDRKDHNGEDHQLLATKDRLTDCPGANRRITIQRSSGWQVCNQSQGDMKENELHETLPNQYDGSCRHCPL
jgi:hypothetical protein